jgi:murein DD-endopeptidase MepM/ murein hydrolase activator NlpD
MNVVIFSKRWARARHFELGHPLWVAAGVLVFAMTMGGSFLAGAHWRASVTTAVAASGPTAVVVNPKAEFQLKDQLADLVARVGQVNAQILRLNALGKRLTEMAHLDKGEFNFDAPPAQGGPDEEDAAPSEAAQELTDVLASLEQHLVDRERQLVILETFISARELTAVTVPDGSPVPGAWISSYFGRRVDPFTGVKAFHSGIDFAAAMGTSARAVAPGVVTWAGERSGYGQLVEINHGNGYVTRYAHNSKLLVKVGDRIAKGQVVSSVGSTGRSTGPHLHFEVLKNGEQIDPLKFVAG